MTTTTAIPARLQEIIEDFQDSDGQEKLDLLLEFADRMPPLPAWLREQHHVMEQVHECMSPVFVHAEKQGDGMHFYFDVPPEAPTIRGYAALLAEGLDGISPQEVLAVPADFFQQMGLQKVLSPQRINGISAVLAHMKRQAVKEM
ncbi:MAG: SufE family protein [Chloroflexaceae bacterium]|jgi:cysteine desulfuration protein SufE|nr:SufE family protein [Chloroflexaceae bacterium]